jgi:hypothetical protein
LTGGRPVTAARSNLASALGANEETMRSFDPLRRLGDILRQTRPRAAQANGVFIVIDVGLGHDRLAGHDGSSP